MRKPFRNYVLFEHEQLEILEWYRSGKFSKILNGVVPLGFVGHGGKADEDSITIFYLFHPEYRRMGLFAPMMKAFAAWCKEKYPEKKFLRANTEAKNIASIQALRKAGFSLLEEKLDGPSEQQKVLFHSYTRNLL